MDERLTVPEETVTPQETTQPSPETVAEIAQQTEPIAEEAWQAQIAELQERLAQVEAEAQDYRERWLRTLADYQNYRKRVMQERVEAYNEGKKEAVLALLPVLDNLERALATLKEGADLTAYRQGLELIVRLFQEALRRLDVEPIPAEGVRFDPHFHEAFERVEREDLEEGVIVSELERGYRMGERVIRPAKVRVAVKPTPSLQAPEPSADNEDGGEGQ
jgi:molecular chaperone GrpE